MAELPMKGRAGMRFWCWLFFMTLLAASLRLYKLDAASFWIDELYTVRDAAGVSQGSWFDVLYKVKALGYVPTAAWLRVSGIDLQSVASQPAASWRVLGIHEVPVRTGSCVIGIATVPLLSLLSRRILGVRAAGFLALLLAVSPWHIYWSQAARFYSLQFLFYNMALILYWTAARNSSVPRLVVTCVLLELAILTQPTALVVFLVFAADWGLSRYLRKPVCLHPLGYLLLALTLGYGLLVSAANIMPELSVIGSKLVGFLGENSPLDRGGTVEGAVSIVRLPCKVLYFVGPLIVLFALMSAWSLRKAERPLMLYLLLAATLPILIFGLLSARPYAGSRYAFMCLYPWLALAALGAERAHRVLRPQLGATFAHGPVALLSLSMMLVNVNYFTYGRGFHPRAREAYEYVARHREPDDKVLDSTFLMLAGYYLQSRNVGFLATSSELSEELDRPTWMVVHKSTPEEPHPADQIATLRARYDVWHVRPLSSISVYYYTPRTGPRAGG